MTTAIHTISTEQPSIWRRRILGIAVEDLSQADALLMLQDAIETRQHSKIAFCNAHTANTAWSDQTFLRALNDFTVFPDGVGMDAAALLLGGKTFAANLNGTDFVPALISGAPRPLTIAMIGGKPGVAERAAAALQAFDGRHRIGPVLDGFADEASVQAWLASLRAAPADLILVAMGNPRQELWIARNLDATHGAVAMGVGALFDFLSGDVARAPDVLRKLRLEWLWRLALEPRRLFARYVIGNPLFLLRVLAIKLGLAVR